MLRSDHANRPRWTGAPGFYEIWFLVVVDPSAARAWWFRYTTFSPLPGRPETPRATIWAAAFDAAAPPVAVKSILPMDRYVAGPSYLFCVQMGTGELTNAFARGDVRAGRHAIAWELRFRPAVREARRGPWPLHHLPLPTRVAHANTDIACAGWVEVDGVRHRLAGAPGIQKHLWGTRRVEELAWLFCPRFAEDPAVRLEASSARLRRGGLAVTPVWLGLDHGCAAAWTGLSALVGNRIEVPAPGELVVHAAATTRGLRARAWAPPSAFVGYVYRDPAGWDAYVAQCDVASCEVDLLHRSHPLAGWQPQRRLTSTHAAALEVHGLAPLPGVRYLGWDETHAAD